MSLKIDISGAETVVGENSARYCRIFSSMVLKPGTWVPTGALAGRKSMGASLSTWAANRADMPAAVIGGVQLYSIIAKFLKYYFCMYSSTVSRWGHV